MNNTTCTATAPTAADLARNTPATRDRYVDFLRLFSITVVVLGHWLIAVVIWHGHTFQTGNVIGMVPGMWLATWLLQVMPIFFFVGGFANFATIDALRRKGQGTAEFIASRVTRFLKPVAVLLAVWFPAAILLERFGLDPRVLRSATKLVCQPLWFIGVYLAVTALAPCMRDLHARHGIRAAAGIALLAVGVDVARFGGGVDALGYLNVLFVWLLAQQLGFFYADDTLLRVRRAHLVAAAAGATTTLAALTTFGPYPRSMVGLPGDRISNMSPPTICLVALTVFEIATAMLLRPVVTRWLQRDRAWTVVVAGNGIIMTIFLWHLTAALIAVDVLYHVGFPQAAGGTATWWLTRPLWIAACALPLIALIRGFGRFEPPRPARYQATGDRAASTAGVGVALLAIVIFGVACSNLADITTNAPIHIAVIMVTPLELAAAAVVGLALIRTATRPATTPSAAPASRSRL